MNPPAPVMIESLGCSNFQLNFAPGSPRAFSATIVRWA
jgi:hypothetical protein